MLAPRSAWTEPICLEAIPENNRLGGGLIGDIGLFDLALDSYLDKTNSPNEESGSESETAAPLANLLLDNDTRIRWSAMESLIYLDALRCALYWNFSPKTSTHH